MKKTLLLLLCVAMATLTNATNNPFKRIKEREQTMNKMKSSSIVVPKTLANVTVPTLVKYSYWDGMTSNWNGQSAIKSIYENDLLKTQYQMNYLQTDTGFRVRFLYNANNQLTQLINEYKQSPGIFIGSYRYSFTYSNNNLKTVVLVEIYDDQTQVWSPSSRQTEEFNSRGETTKYLNEMYNNGSWEVQFGYASQYTYLNSTSNKIVELIDSSYNFNIMRFEADYKEVKSYNGNGEVIDILSYQNMGSGLKLSNKDSIFYTAGIPTKLIGYEYDSLSSTFNKTFKIDDLVWASFNPTIDLFYNQPLAFVASSWRNNAWQFEERNTTTYTDNFGSYIQLTEVYNSNNVWVNQYRYKEVYDSRLNLIESADENYNIQTSNWNPVYGEKHFFQYDMSNNITEEITEQFNSTNNAYEKTGKYENSGFISIASGINTSINTLEVKLYPNPSADGKVSVNVKMEAASELSIKITDLKGSVVYTDTKELGKGLNTVELNGLQQGMYVVEMSTEYGVSRTKLIVQ